MPMLPRIPLAKGDRWMEVSEIAALLGVDPETVNRLCRAGAIPSTKPTGKRRYVKKSDFNKYLESRGVQPV